MTLERLRKIEKAIPAGGQKRAEGSPRQSRRELKKLKKQVKEKAKDFYSRLKKLGEILESEHFEGKLDLGTDVESINWPAMPKKVADCFRPEFGYQPEEITAFYISSGKNSLSREASIGIRLERNNVWWSYISAGSIVRKNYCVSTMCIICRTNSVQPLRAREAMSSLRESLGKEARRLDFSLRGLLYQDLSEFRLTNSILDFAATELERQIP